MGYRAGVSVLYSDEQILEKLTGGSRLEEAASIPLTGPCIAELLIFAPQTRKHKIRDMQCFAVNNKKSVCKGTAFPDGLFPLWLKG